MGMINISFLHVEHVVAIASVENMGTRSKRRDEATSKVKPPHKRILREASHKKVLRY